MAGVLHCHGVARRGFRAIFASIVIALAIGSLLGRLLVPMVDRVPTQVADLLGWYLGQPVAVGSLQGQWQAGGPLLSVADLRIGEGSEALILPRAQVKLDVTAWFDPGQRWLELRVRGIEAELRADDNGAWHLTGLSFRQQQEGGQARLPDSLPLGILVRDLRLRIRDPARGLKLALQVPALRVVSRDGKMLLGGRLRLPGKHGGIDLTAEVDSRRHSGRLYMMAQDSDLKAWSAALAPGSVQIEKGQGDVRLWLAWNRGAITHMAARLALQDVLLTNQEQARVHWPKLAGVLQARGDRQHWRLFWQPRSIAGNPPGQLAVQRLPGGLLRVRAEQLPLARFAPLSGLWSGLRAAPDWSSLQARGMLQELRVDWRNAKDFRLFAEIRDAGWQPAGHWPGLDHLDATVRGDNQAVSLYLPEQAVTVDYPSVFREPFVFHSVSGNLAFWSTEHAWQLATDGLDLQARNYHVRLRGGLHDDPERPLPILDVAARVTDAEVPAAKLFWPVNVMPPSAVQWLDRALVSGKVSGRALFRGNLGDWPFGDGSGRFEAVADFGQAVLDFHPDWPAAEGLVGQARFINTSMQVTTTAGRTLDNAVDQARATIADFGEAELQLQVDGEGRSDQLLAWLRKTPIGVERAEGLDAIILDAQARYALSLNLPLHDGAEQAMRLDGQVDLQQGKFRAPAWHFALENLQGRVAFDARGVRANGLSASYHGTPVSLAAAVGRATGDPGIRLLATMQGQFNTQTLIRDYPELEPLTEVALGTAEFDVQLQVQSDDNPAVGQGQLRIRSDLQGMALELPAPLKIPAIQSRQLQVDIPLPRHVAPLRIRIGDVVDAAIRLPTGSQALAADVALGGAAAKIPAPGIVIHGQVPRFDLTGWVGQFAAWAGGSNGVSGGGAPALNLYLVAEDALLGGRPIGPLQLKIQQGSNEVHVVADGPSVAGSVRIPLVDLSQRGVTVQMQRFYWPAGDGADQQSGSAKSASLVGPADVPPLHVSIQDLHLGNAKLGQVRLEAVPVGDALHVQQFQAESDNMTINARGTWRGTAEHSRSRFSIDMSADDLGGMLSGFGYPRLIAGGNTLIHIEGEWPGSPATFSLLNLDGYMQIDASDGRILKVDPGLGRLIGLFSIRELPRRLSLDFGDVFQSGYTFNQIEGRFRFHAGNAYTDNLEMQGPAADIALRGRVGLVKRDYEELISVTPHLGVAFPVVGGIAAGPVGVAAGLAVQGLLGKGVSQVGKNVYQITGSWDDPEIRHFSGNQVVPEVPVAPPQEPPMRSQQPDPAASVPQPASPGSG